ncbi:hypothetical protein FA15DRAFT_755399 [Coprinopsis marcescibilis]|uniref:Uncharacterized protein n=1 Tax=Coprinopsis marcescibilis TaxID=230819 RepID=A0A5C3L0G7_COPMA|nr:hypothetical protein FA15DRAFT_755399 [Coprinopsis marcescibilis]
MAPAAAATSGTKKRKPTKAEAEVANKKQKLSEEGAVRVKAILEDASNFSIPQEEASMRLELLELARYARSLEEDLASLTPKPKSENDLNGEVTKLSAAILSGIKKQMTWKPTCKSALGSKWAYDGVCNDAKVFGLLVGLDSPPTFKMKKYTTQEFYESVGYVDASARYSNLYLRGTITIRWPGDGTFKFSGSYGVSV